MSLSQPKLNLWLTLLCWLLGIVSLSFVFQLPTMLNTYILSGQLLVISNPLLTEHHVSWSILVALFIVSFIGITLSGVWGTFALANKQRNFYTAFRLFLLSAIVAACAELYESYLYYDAPTKGDRGQLVFTLLLLLVAAVFNRYVAQSKTVRARLIRSGVLRDKVTWPARLYASLTSITLWSTTYDYRFMYFGDHFLTSYGLYVLILIGLVWTIAGWIRERDS